jgi:hypothetical protein
VVSTAVGGIDEMIEHGRSGLLCPPGDDEAIAAALLRMIEQPEVAAGFGVTAARHVTRAFAIQHLAERWEHLYRQVDARGLAPDPMTRPGRRFQTTPTQPVAETMPVDPSSVLVLRLCPLPVTVALLTELRRRFPRARVTCLCQDEVLDELGDRLPWVEYVSYGSGPFALARLGSHRLRSLWLRGVDCVVVPYNDARRRGYGQAELAALLLSRAAAIAVDAWTTPIGTSRVFTWRSLVERRMRRIADGPKRWSRATDLFVRAVRYGLRRQPMWRFGAGGVE